MNPTFPEPSTISLKLVGGDCSVIRTLPSKFPERLARAIFIFMRYSFSPIFSRLSQPGMAPASTSGSWSFLYASSGGSGRKYDPEIFTRLYLSDPAQRHGQGPRRVHGC